MLLPQHPWARCGSTLGVGRWTGKPIMQVRLLSGSTSKPLDPRLNYGREIVSRYLSSVAPFNTALDLGAGEGKDLEAARSACPTVRALAVEGYPPYAEQLESLGFEVHRIDLEHDRLPFGDNSIDVIMTNQVLEHIKEVFWIFHEISRILGIRGHLIIGVPNPRFPP